MAIVSALPAHADVTYQEQIRPLLQNNCLNCHNADKHKAGLDLSTYDAAMEGSDGGKVVEAGSAEKSLLYKVITHAEEPFMPQKADKLPDAQIEMIRQWIEASAPEKAGGMVAKKSQAPIATVAAVDEKPQGPPVMPHDALLEPVVRTARPGAVPSIAASPWAPLVALAGQKQVLLYDTDAMELAAVLPFAEGFPTALRFSRNGTLLIAGGGVGAKLGHVAIYDVATGKRIAQAGDEFDTVLAADLSPDQSEIALGGPSRLVKIYSVRDGTLLHKMKKHTDWVTAVCFTPDGKHLVTGDRAGGLAVWDKEGREEQSMSADQGAITGIACQGGLVVTASEDGMVKLWDIAEGKEKKSWKAHAAGVRSVAFSRDGRLVTSGRDHLVRLWNVNGGQLKQYGPLPDIAMAAAWVGGKIVAADWTGQVRVWMEAGQDAGAFDANPPKIADRLEAASRRVNEVQAPRAKAGQVEKEAGERLEALNRKATELAAGREARKKEQAGAQARLADLQKQAPAAEAAAKKAADDLQAARKAAAAGQREAEAVAAVKHSSAAPPALAMSFPEFGPVAMAVDAARGVEAGVQTRLSAMHAAEAKAQAGSATAQSRAEKLRADSTLAQAAVNRAAGAFQALAQPLAAAQTEVKNGAAALQAAQAAAEKVEAEAKLALQDLQKWRAAQIRVAMIAAEDEVAARQAECDRAAELEKAAAAPLEAARQQVAAAQEKINNAPQLLKAAEEAIAQAKAAAEAAHANQAAAEKLTANRQAQAKAAAGLALQLRAQPPEPGVQASAVQAAAYAERLQAAVKAVHLAAQAKAKTAAQADANVAAQAAAHDKLNADLAAAPGALPALQAAVARAGGAAKAARDLAAKQTAECAQRLAQARAKLETLTAQYRATKPPVLTVLNR